MKKTNLSLILAALLVMLAVSSLIAGSPVSGDAPGGSAGVSGVVKFQGSALKPSRIDMSSDPNCAKAHPTPATTEDLITGNNGGLENVIVYVADGLGDKTFDPPSQPASIEQKGCTYKPHVLAMQANQKLQVVNADSTTHNIHPMPANNREWNKTQPPGVPIEETFAREEISIPVKCNIHPWMHGYIAVFKHPFFAVSDKNGDFELKDLPPGTYTIKAWHEKLGTLSQKITVSGPGQKVEFDFKQ